MPSESRPRMTMMVAFAVSIGNLGTGSPERRPMADLVRYLDAALRVQGGRIRVLEFFRQMGNFILECEAQTPNLARALRLFLGTPCVIVSVARIAGSSAAVQALPAPAKERGQRWSPGVVFHVNGFSSSAPVKDTHGARFHPSDDSTILAWKRDLEDSRGRLDKKRRGGGWGAASSAVGRQIGGVWTARSASTLDGVLVRIDEARVCVQPRGAHNAPLEPTRSGRRWAQL